MYHLNMLTEISAKESTSKLEGDHENSYQKFYPIKISFPNKMRNLVLYFDKLDIRNNWYTAML